MINKLRKQFPSLVVMDKITFDSRMLHYRLSNGLYIGIHKDEVTDKDRNLLSVFTTPISTVDSISIEQTIWREALLSNEKENVLAHYGEKDSFRLIHFFLQEEVEISSFEEAITSLSFSHKVVVWVNLQNVVIIEQINQEMIQKDELVNLRNAIATDFYTDLYIYTGAIFTLNQSISEIYDWETQCFQLSRSQLKNQGVFQFFESIPYILLRDTNELTRTKMTNLVSDFTKEEIHTIKVFIESGLNISFTAKKLFMHRNSLQYRVDKFSEKTGIELKSFQGALVVYLAILSKNY